MSGVPTFECDEDWRGVFGVVLSVKETRGEVRLERVKVDLPFIADTCWLIFVEIVQFSIKLIEEEEDN